MELKLMRVESNDVQDGKYIVPKNVTAINQDAFASLGWEGESLEVILPEGMEEINDFAFRSCGRLEKIHIPSTVQIIGESAFEDCGRLEQVEFPYNLKEIYTYAFFGCTNLSEVIIPESVEHIEFGAFFECIHLTEVTIPTHMDIEDCKDVFRSCPLKVIH